MNVFVWANCQGAAFGRFLPSFVPDTKNFNFKHVENYKAMAGETPIEVLCDIAKWADVFIYQPIGLANDFFSTVLGHDNIRARLRPDCHCISFPYLYNNGLWPFYLEDDGTQNGAMFDAMLEAGATLGDLLEAYDSGQLDCRFDERIEASLENFRLREVGYEIDVKLYDFLREGLKQSELFLTQSHPTTACFAEALARTFQIMLGREFRSSDIDLVTLGRNFIDLPGRYPIDHYCAEQLSSVFRAGPDEGAANFYRSVIHIHHERWLSAKAERDALA